jgi:hypothetical protein
MIHDSTSGRLRNAGRRSDDYACPDATTNADKRRHVRIVRKANATRRRDVQVPRLLLALSGKCEMIEGLISGYAGIQGLADTFSIHVYSDNGRTSGTHAIDLTQGGFTFNGIALSNNGQLVNLLCKNPSGSVQCWIKDAVQVGNHSISVKGEFRIVEGEVAVQ